MMQNNNKDKILTTLKESGFYISRMFGSKSGYRERFPNHDVVFNANLIDKNLGKIWHGDLDITLDGEKLRAAAKKHNTIFYILYESDARFKNEGLSTEEYIKKSYWNTDN